MNNYEHSLPSLTEIDAELYRRDFYSFVKSAFSVLHNGQELVDNWHIKYLCDVLQKEGERIANGEKREKHIVINVPPRTLKSEIANVYFSVWLWVIKPDIQFISSSYSHSLSLRLSLQARRIIETDWFRNMYPNISLSVDENTKGLFSNDSGGLRYTTSTGGTITGMGGDVIVIDDPQNPQLARSEVERKNANLFFNETLRSRLNNPDIGVFIIIMQRLHENDLTGHVLALEPDKWQHICLPAEITGNIKPNELINYYRNNLLFPERLSEETLSGFKVGLGSYGYSGQYLQAPSQQDGGIIKREWFEIVENKPSDVVYDFYIDTAYTNKQTNDPTSILIGGRKDNLFYIAVVYRVWLEFPELIKYIITLSSQHENANTKIYIEPKASGKSIAQQLKRETMLNIIETKPPDTDKISRVNAVAPIIESKRVKLIKGIWNEDFLTECAAFPNAQHDDQVDTLTMFLSNNNKSFLDQFL